MHALLFSIYIYIYIASDYSTQAIRALPFEVWASLLPFLSKANKALWPGALK